MRATGARSPTTAKTARVADHNPAEWALWIGRPLLGQWTFDVRRLLDALERADGTLPRDVLLVGDGPAGIVALCAGAIDRRINRVATVGTLASYVTDRPYTNQRLGIMAPGILRDVGDVAHLAALNAPHRLVIAGGVAGSGEPVAAGPLRATYRDASRAWELLGAGPELRILETTDPAEILRALAR